MTATALAAHLIDEIGAEREVEALLVGSTSESDPTARFLLGSLYSAWPGHLRQAREVLEPVAAEDEPSKWSRPLAMMATELLAQVAAMEGNPAEAERWRKQREQLEASQGEFAGVLESSDEPTTFANVQDTEPPATAPRGAHRLIYSQMSFRINPPAMRRFELLERGWHQAWTPDETKLGTVMDEFAGHRRKGYAQAGLIEAMGVYRSGDCAEALRRVDAALAEWNTPDALALRGRLLRAAILVDCGRIDDLPELLEAAPEARPPEKFQDLAQTFARAMRYRARGGAEEDHSAAVAHEYLGVLFAALEEWGAAWFENRKYLAWLGRNGDLADALDRSIAEMARMAAGEDWSGFDALVEQLRSGKNHRLEIDGYSDLRLEVNNQGGQVRLEGSWGRRLVHDGSDQAFYQTALLLAKRYLEADWTPAGPVFRTLVPVGSQNLTGAALGAFVRSQVQVLEMVRRMAASGLLSVAFKITDDGTHAGIAFDFEEPSPGEAVEQRQRQLRKPGGTALKRAEVHWQLAESYLQSKEGSRRENLQAAIQAYEAALGLVNKSEHPSEWANVQRGLGGAWLEMARFTPEAALKAGDCFEAALSVYTRSADKLAWGRLMLNRSQAARMSPRPKVRNAIDYSQAGLAAFDAGSVEWALAQESLGLAYLEEAQEAGWSGKRRNEPIARAHECFAAALRVNTRQRDPYRWAALESYLADCYALMDGEDPRQTTARAIAALNSTLEVFVESQYPWDRALVQAKLAAAYLEESAWLPESASNAMASGQAALRVFTKDAAPERWVSLQMTLGAAYMSLGGADRKGELEQAIVCFEEAVSVESPARSLPGWKAEWSRKMGLACLAYSAYEHARLPETVDRFNHALGFYKQSSHPGMWAELHAALGQALWSLEPGARDVNLRKAIHHTSLCLKVAAPGSSAWALHHERLGQIQLDLYEFAPEALAKAFEEFALALSVFTREADAVRWAANQDFLGRAFAAMQTGRRPENLETAIGHFRRSLEVFAAAEYPADRAEVLEKLVYALVESAGERGPERIQEAIGAAREGLQALSRESHPRLWAALQDALGVAYTERATGPEIAQGIALQMLALEAYPKERYPVDYAIVQAHVGFSHLGQAEIWPSDEFRGLALRNFEIAAEALTRERSPRRWASIRNGMGSACRRREDTLERAAAFHRAALQVFTAAAFPMDHAQANLDLAKTYIHFEGAEAGRREEVKRSLEAALAYFNRQDFPRKQAAIGETMRAAGLGDLPAH